MNHLLKKIKAFRHLLLIFCICQISLLSIESKEKTKPLEGYFKDAVVYTGVIQYYFEDVKTKKEIRVDVVTDGTSLHKVPKFLLENPEDVDGLIGGNPKMFGKKFLLYTMDNGGIKIVLKKGKKK